MLAQSEILRYALDDVTGELPVRIKALYTRRNVRFECRLNERLSENAQHTRQYVSIFQKAFHSRCAKYGVCVSSNRAHTHSKALWFGGR